MNVGFFVDAFQADAFLVTRPGTYQPELARPAPPYRAPTLQMRHVLDLEISVGKVEVTADIRLVEDLTTLL